MQLVADVLFWIMALVALVGFRRTGQRQFLVPVLVGVVAPFLNLGFLPTMRVHLGAIELVLLTLVLLLLAMVQGLPDPIARRIRFGLQSREWEFDRRLCRYCKEVDHLLRAYPASRDWDDYQRWKRRVLAEGRSALRRMGKIHAPNHDRAQVRDDYVELYGRILERINTDQPPDDDDTLERGTELVRRADALRTKYRAATQTHPDG